MDTLLSKLLSPSDKLVIVLKVSHKSLRLEVVQDLLVVHKGH